MDAKRQGEIALELVKFKLRKDGIMISRDKMRELGSVAQATGIDQEELKKFFWALVDGLIKEMNPD